MSVRLSYDEFIHIGKAKYQEKKYDLAYDYFKRALSTLKTPNLDILDFLAATCEKLGNTSEALKYGSQMIKSHSTSAKVRQSIPKVRQVNADCLKGYLRVGRSLQLANKDGYKEKEIAIYDRGLGKVPRIDPQYKVGLLRLSLAFSDSKSFSKAYVMLLFGFCVRQQPLIPSPFFPPKSAKKFFNTLTFMRLCKFCLGSK